MNKMSIEEKTKYFEFIINARVDAFTNEEWEVEKKLREVTNNLLQEESLLYLLVIKKITSSIILDSEIEEEIERRIELATENNC